MYGKALNIEQKSFLKEQGINPKDFLFYSKDFESFTFIHRDTGKKIYFRRWKYARTKLLWKGRT